MRSVTQCSSSEAVQGLLTLVAAVDPVIDVTYGNGAFWVDSPRRVWGGDRDRARARSFVADFTALPFQDQSCLTVVYDPPFHPFVGSAEQARFSGLGRNEIELRQGFELGLREAWRVCARHLLVKCQGFVHNHRPQWMPLWTTAICGEPFEWLIVWREGKRESGRWRSTRSLRRNHADYLLFDRRGTHR